METQKADLESQLDKIEAAMAATNRLQRELFALDNARFDALELLRRAIDNVMNVSALLVLRRQMLIAEIDLRNAENLRPPSSEKATG